MKLKTDKLRNRVWRNHKILYFLLGLFIIGIGFGALLTVMMKAEDQTLVADYLNQFFTQLKGNDLNYGSAFIQSILSNVLFILGIWLLGISVIGIPIMIFMYFSKAFILGFTIASMIQNFSWKGIVLALFYTFPHQILGMIVYTILMIYAMTLSMTLIKAFMQKKTIDFKKVINKYLFILGICFIGALFMSLSEVFLMPFLMKFVVS